MNTISPETMLHCHHIPTTISAVHGGSDVTVFERQQERMKWQHQQQQQQQSFFNGSLLVKPDPDSENGWPDFSHCCDDQLGYVINQSKRSHMGSSPPPLMADQRTLERVTSSSSAKKRKTHDDLKPKVVAEENGVKEKKMKGSDSSTEEKSKVTEAKKQDFIHVRARRGQATDSHSLAERVRREKISERMKYLQDLVPGCNKITGKAGMLDEIISYVQCLQRQVEFLSMKLATVHPRLDANIDDLIAKEMFASSSCEVSMVGYASEMATSTYLQLNSLLEMGTNPFDTVLRRIGGPVSIPETFVVSSCLNQIQPNVTWDADLQNLYRMELQQETSTIPYQSQKFTGLYEDSNMKMEM